MNRRQSEFAAQLGRIYREVGKEMNFYPYRSVIYDRKRKGFVVHLVTVTHAPLGFPEVYKMDDPDGIPIHRIRAHIETARNLWLLAQ